jgi:hypothetical protein
MAQAMVTVPLAVEHARHPSLGYALAQSLRADASRLEAGGRPSALLVTEPLLFVSLPALPPRSALVYVDPSVLSGEARRLEAQGYVVYATAPPPEASEGWRLVAHLRRSLAQSPPGPPETWLFRRGAP